MRAEFPKRGVARLVQGLPRMGTHLLKSLAPLVLVLGAGSLGCAMDPGDEEELGDSADAIVAKPLECSSKLMIDNLFFRDSLDANATVSLKYKRTKTGVVFTSLTFAADDSGNFQTYIRSSARPKDGEFLKETFFTYYQGGDHDYLNEDRITRPVQFTAPRGAKITIRMRNDITYARDSHGLCTVTVP